MNIKKTIGALMMCAISATPMMAQQTSAESYHPCTYQEMEQLTVNEQVTTVITASEPIWKSHATLTLLATQDLPTFGYNMIDPLKSWCWGSILFYPFKISRFS